MKLQFFAQGLPKGQPRAKACLRGKHAGIYDPGTADDWKTVVRKAAAAAIDWTFKDAVVIPVFNGPTRIDIEFYFPRPNFHFRKTGLRLDAPTYHTGKPDRDNLDKAVLDALTDLQVLKDDAQVCAGSISKYYAPEGGACGAQITITSLPVTQ